MGIASSPFSRRRPSAGGHRLLLPAPSRRDPSLQRSFRKGHRGRPLPSTSLAGETPVPRAGHAGKEEAKGREERWLVAEMPGSVGLVGKTAEKFGVQYAMELSGHT